MTDTNQWFAKLQAEGYMFPFLASAQRVHTLVLEELKEILKELDLSKTQFVGLGYQHKKIQMLSSSVVPLKDNYHRFLSDYGVEAYLFISPSCIVPQLSCKLHSDERLIVIGSSFGHQVYRYSLATKKLLLEDFIQPKQAA